LRPQPLHLAEQVARGASPRAKFPGGQQPWAPTQAGGVGKLLQSADVLGQHTHLELV
jgi:hypothetical protein